jgi:hypothetical protein
MARKKQPPAPPAPPPAPTSPPSAGGAGGASGAYETNVPVEPKPPAPANAKATGVRCTACGLRSKTLVAKKGTSYDGQAFGVCNTEWACKRRQHLAAVHAERLAAGGAKA